MEISRQKKSKVFHDPPLLECESAINVKCQKACNTARRNRPFARVILQNDLAWPGKTKRDRNSRSGAKN